MCVCVCCDPSMKGCWHGPFFLTIFQAPLSDESSQELLVLLLHTATAGVLARAKVSPLSPLAGLELQQA